MPLIRKDVTIKTNSTATKEQIIASSRGWVESLQEEPEFVDDLYYAEIFDSRDGSIYRIFSQKSMDEYNINLYVYDILTPEMLRYQEYVQESIEPFLSEEQIINMLSDYYTKDDVDTIITGLSNTSSNNVNRLNQIDSLLTGFVTNQQLTNITDLQYTKQEVDDLIAENSIDDSDFVLNVDLLSMLKNVVTMDQFVDQLSTINSTLDTILDIEDIILDPLFTSKVIELIDDNTDGVTTEDLSNLVEDTELATILQGYTQNATLQNILEFYLKIDDVRPIIVEYLSEYVTKDYLNNLLPLLATKEELESTRVELNTQITNIENINRVNDTYISDLLDLSENYSSVSSDIINMKTELVDIQNSLNTDSYCTLKKNVERINKSLILLTQDVEGIFTRVTNTEGKVNGNTSRIINLENTITQLTSIQQSIILNSTNLAQLTDTVNNMSTQVTEGITQEVINNINQYISLPVENIKDELTLLINSNTDRITALENNLIIEQGSNMYISIVNEISKDFVTISSIIETFNVDYEDVIWKSLQKGFNEYNCTH